MGAVSTLLAKALRSGPLDGVAEVTVRKVNADTGATVAQVAGVTAYRKGGASQVVTADGPTVRTSQFRLVMPDDGLGFEVEAMCTLVIEADGRRWQVRQADKAVADSQRICQCADLGIPTAVSAVITYSVSGGAISLDGSGSTGDQLSYEWIATGPALDDLDFSAEDIASGDWVGNTATVASPGSLDFSGSPNRHVPLGGYAFELTVTDDGGTADDAVLYGLILQSGKSYSAAQAAAISGAPTGAPVGGAGDITVSGITVPVGAAASVLLITQDASYIASKSITSSGSLSFSGLTAGDYEVSAYSAAMGRNGDLASLGTVTVT